MTNTDKTHDPMCFRKAQVRGPNPRRGSKSPGKWAGFLCKGCTECTQYAPVAAAGGTKPTQDRGRKPLRAVLVDLVTRLGIIWRGLR
jgi:hypothetical protein